MVPYTSADFRFTTKGDALYAIEMAWPSAGEAVIKTLSSGHVAAPSVSDVTLLSTGAKLTYTQKPDGLHIQVPSEAPGKYAYVYRIHFAGSTR